MSWPGFCRRNRIHKFSLLCQLSQPSLRRFCLCREGMDAHANVLGGFGGHQCFIVLGLQTCTGNQATESAIHERIGKLIHNISQMLKFERIGKDAMHIPLIPSDRLPIRRQDDIFFRSTMEPLSIRPPAFQGDLSGAGNRAFDIHMNHWAICIDPEADRAFQITSRRVNGDASGF